MPDFEPKEKTSCMMEGCCSGKGVRRWDRVRGARKTEGEATEQLRELFKDDKFDESVVVGEEVVVVGESRAGRKKDKGKGKKRKQKIGIDDVWEIVEQMHAVSLIVQKETEVWRGFNSDIAEQWHWSEDNSTVGKSVAGAGDISCRSPDIGGSDEDSSPVADDGRWDSTAEHDQDSQVCAPEPKPLDPALTAEHLGEIRAREDILQYQKRQVDSGKEAIGVWVIKDGKKRWQAEVRDWALEEEQAKGEEQRVSTMNCFCLPEKEGAPLCGAWQVEEAGWTKVDVVMDSGAAESVCPRSMCPQYPIQDSAASIAGVFYTAANGER